MVPKVAGKGTSFKGAGLYYLHDKGALSSERVAFTHTLNLATDDPEKALRVMAYTAMHQAEIKRAAGSRATGRKLRDPVYTYSLSWAPGETPSNDDMIAAGMETLQRLGLTDHEAVLIAHKDAAHPHLHIVVNRVNPETGLAAPLSNDHLKLSQWAEEYERGRGQILCAQRVDNNRRRRDQFVKQRRDADYHRFRRDRVEADLIRRENETKTLTQKQRAAAEKLIADRRAALERVRSPLRKKHQYAWSALYEKQRHERRDFDHALKTDDKRLAYFLKNREIDRWAGSSLDRQGMLSRAFAGKAKEEILRKALADKQEAERKALALRLKAIVDERTKTVRAMYDDAIRDQRRAHAKENSALAKAHSEQSQEQARTIARGGGRTAYDFERAATGKTPAPDFNKAADSAAAEKQKTADHVRDAAPPAPEQKPARKKLSPFRDMQAERDKAKDRRGADTPTPEPKPERRKFTPFTDLRDGKDQGQDRRDGRGRSIKPPGSDPDE